MAYLSGRPEWTAVLPGIMLVGMLLWFSALSADGPPADGGDSGEALEQWLNRAEQQPKDDPAQTPHAEASRPPRATAVQTDALPGVVELSSGRKIGGMISTTPGRPWEVWIEESKRWRHIPPAAVLEISAVVVEQKLEPQWRWKAMGEPEKVYTGKTYPRRRFRWRFALADGSQIEGVIKGQPLWIRTPDGMEGPFLLAERSRGDVGETLEDLSYLRRVVLSRRMLEAYRETDGTR